VVGPGGDGGDGAISSAMVSANRPPTATDRTYTVAPTGTLSVSAAESPLATGSDPDDTATALDVRIVSEPTNGSLAVDADGSFTYVPERRVPSTDTFVYEVRDTLGKTDRGVVTVAVEGERETAPPTTVATTTSPPPSPTATPTTGQSPTPTTGATGPGFGVVLAILAGTLAVAIRLARQ
jgi:hypothetical protein